LYVKNGHRDNYLSEPEFPLRLRLRLRQDKASWVSLVRSQRLHTEYKRHLFMPHTWILCRDHLCAMCTRTEFNTHLYFSVHSKYSRKHKNSVFLERLKDGNIHMYSRSGCLL